MNCASKEWVPYDSSISPMENFYDKATDLDPQPEFTVRTKFAFFVEGEPEVDKFMVQDGETIPQQQMQQRLDLTHEIPPNNSPPFTTLLILWFFGLIVWCMVFVNHGGSNVAPTKKRLFKRKIVGGAKEV